MKYMLSPLRTRPSLQDESMTNSPKKQRTCGTPSSADNSPLPDVFRPGRTKLFDTETEELLMIRRSSLLQQPSLDDSSPTEGECPKLVRVTSTEGALPVLRFTAGDESDMSDVRATTQ